MRFLRLLFLFGGLLLLGLLVRHFGLESANAAAFAALGWVAGDGLAFSLVRRGRQVVWVGIGLGLLWIMGAMRARGMEGAGSARTRAD